MLDSNSLPSPMCPKTTLSKFDCDHFNDMHLYRSIVGALQYATLTRPNIAFSVNKVSQLMQAPSTTHWAAVKRILRYLKGTIGHGILLQPSSSLSLHAFSDANWAGSTDDRKSTSGFCVFLGANIISWGSKKQPTVARSSNEAEYKSLANTSSELVWLQYLLAELHVTLSSPPILWCDNIGAIFSASNPMINSRTKHVEIDYHFMREHVANKSLQIQFLSFKDQVADIFTKPLVAPRFGLLSTKLTIFPSGSACGEGGGGVIEHQLRISQQDIQPSQT